MKIQLYARNFPPSGSRFTGGLNKAVHGLAAGLVENGVEVTVLCSSTEDSSFQASTGYQIRCFKRDLPQRLGLTLSPGLRRYIEACDPADTFILNGVFTPDTFLVSRACLQNNLRYFCWPHDPYNRALFAKKSYLKWPYWYLRDRPMLRRAQAIQVFDIRHTQWLRDLGVNTATIEMDNGSDPVDAIAESELKWNSEGPPRLIYLGRIDYYNKGLDILLDAFADLAKESDSQLTLQGPDNGDLEMLKERAEKLGLTGERLHFNQAQFDRTASQILIDHDVFMLPSRFEGFALAALEAMVCGRVLMISDMAGMAKHVEAAGCGVVVQPDKASVISGFKKLMEARPRWKEMGLAGREYALRHFQWNRIAADLLSNYSRFET